MRKEWSSFLQIFITSIEECMILSFDTIGPFMHCQYLNVCSVIVTSYPGALLEKNPTIYRTKHHKECSMD